MKTSAYSSRQATLRVDLEDVNNAILERPPISDDERAQVLLLHGQRSALLDELSFFEDSCAKLKELILQAEDEATQRAANTTTN